MVILSFGMAILIVLPHGLFFAYFKIREHQLKEAALSKISTIGSDDSLVLLKIPFETEQNKTVFKRFHSREFRYRGFMYDVARTEVHENETWYWCIQDEHETELMEKKEAYFSNLWQQEVPQNKTASAYNQYINLLYTIRHNSFNINIINENIKHETHQKDTTCFSLKNNPPTPPPIRI